MVQKHILLINPNTTSSMTQKIDAAARHAAGPAVKITAVNPATGPSAIQGAEDGRNALPGLFKTFEDHVLEHRGVDAVIIACFDDTGLWELKRKSPVPVLGIGEAAYHAASLYAERFSVVTTLPVSVPVLEKNLDLIGLARRCAKVRASNVPVLELEDPESPARHRIEAEINLAIKEDDVGAIALGCAGMADLAADLSRQFEIPVIDGVAAATRFAEQLVS
ncbi:aspartate/glutamate racemase family protein [Roseibium album]|uniref:Hydantoin racemase n=1 Tax=Roseibium album TaxID=311410 RepID=A0A0M7A5P6_9HYPH|nr:aspartate/glutamate racemase family protein [Roseibium album]CTQ57958.1 Hydantoin racemase [Roseibium album]CTQ67730.1 Hydantoin racemase [Roseibium album]CTQ70219.1 Hydantoin racemase [Roseibium album]